ncbi:TonB-dependent receptor [Dyella nitratireducens]|uniref:TonB-dependent receptor n=1 Tax=Dyella nitratireducens TaxID=1849580 RepID=A0ABQ1GK22_9GAMM|nr:TonB-dependent receptor [Dyella nitratireducens]GGA45350.1 TonB-dependent receptor [Dyella nitratireducens]GLQ41307.1 TonB-dependent receptor [Dyella nitratireducens]
MTYRPNRRDGKNRRVSLIALSSLTLAIGQAFAQSTQPPAGSDGTKPASTTTTLEAVQVTGKTLSVEKAIVEKRTLPVISDGISADEIGSVPDFGLGEAVQRIPGVAMTINNGRGEAQFLNLRGLNPDYNSVMVDGIALPSTETTSRNVSLDVLPASLAQQVSIYKTVTADMPADAIGGVVNLRTRSAFDHLGLFVSGRADYAHWDNSRVVAHSGPSGQIENTLSDTFGSQRQFGFLLSTSYYRRDSSSLDTAMDTDGYYKYTGGTQKLSSLGQNSAGTGSTLSPNNNVDGLVAVPDRHRWLSYDNVRQREGVLGKFEYDNHENLQAHLTGGFFQHENNELRRSQFLARVGPATLTSDTTGSFAKGAAQVDFDHYDQVRQIKYAELGSSFEPDERSQWDLVANYAIGNYRQTTQEDVLTSAASSKLGFGYDASPGGVALFTPANPSYYMNPANYLQTSYMNALERSKSGLLTLKLDFNHNLQEDATGWGYKAGVQYRNLQQRYDLNQIGYAPTSAVSLAAIGTEDVNFQPYDGNGQNMLLIDPAKVTQYVIDHPGLYAPVSTNARTSAISDFNIREATTSGYAMAGYHDEQFMSVVGLRYEDTSQDVQNTQPNPLNSLTNFAKIDNLHHYGKLLPSTILAYSLQPDLILRAGASETLARASYAALAQNSAPTVSLAGNTISQTIGNPNLVPRKSTNYDLSLEWYPASDAMLSLAAFQKRIQHEIVNLTTTTSETNPDGLTGTYLVTTTEAQNASTAKVKGLEFGATKLHFDFLPGVLSHLGATFNATLLDMDGSAITMKDGSQRQLPMLVGAAKHLLNASLLYNQGPFSAQVSANHTGKMPISFATDNAVNDIYYAQTQTYDAQLRYLYNSHVSFLLQGKNLTNARPTRVLGPDQSLIKEELDNGRAYYLGVTYVL